MGLKVLKPVRGECYADGCRWANRPGNSFCFAHSTYQDVEQAKRALCELWSLSGCVENPETMANVFGIFAQFRGRERLELMQWCVEEFHL